MVGGCSTNHAVRSGTGLQLYSRCLNVVTHASGISIQWVWKHRRTPNFRPGGAVNHLPKKFMQVAQIFTKQSKRNEGHTMQQHRPYWHMKVPRYSFSGSIPAKFEHKLRRHKQTFGKIATTVVLDKDKNLSWSGLQWHESCHSNEMTPLPIILAALFLTVWNRSWEPFPPIVASIFVKLKRIL